MSYLNAGDPGSFQDMTVNPNPAYKYADYAEKEIARLQNELEKKSGWFYDRNKDDIPDLIREAENTIASADERSAEWVQCPVCSGYGGWNLELNAYGDKRHFKAFCSQCHGWGWVHKGGLNETCVHSWSERTIGNCLHEWTCTQCGQKREVDSSG